MTLSKTFILREPVDWQALVAFVKQNAGALAKAGTPMVVNLSLFEAKPHHSQRNLLHHVLQDIASNAWVGGRQHAMKTWKEHYAQTFIGTEDVELLDGKLQRRAISTESLSAEQYRDFTTKVIEHAISELGVEFPWLDREPPQSGGSGRT